MWCQEKPPHHTNTPNFQNASTNKYQSRIQPLATTGPVDPAFPQKWLPPTGGSSACPLAMPCKLILELLPNLRLRSGVRRLSSRRDDSHVVTSMNYDVALSWSWSKSKCKPKMADITRISSPRILLSPLKGAQTSRLTPISPRASPYFPTWLVENIQSTQITLLIMGIIGSTKVVGRTRNQVLGRSPIQ